MKFVVTVAAVVALVASADAALSAACQTYITGLSAPTNPLSQCRTYTTLGFPAITGKGDHDTKKFAGNLDTYCAKPACTDAQYKSVFDDIKKNCEADFKAENQADLGAAMFMWYLSPAQHDAICYKSDVTKNYCVVESMDSMIARNQLPNNNPNEDDMYGYLQAVTPLQNPGNMTSQDFCTPCNQQVANIFANYYKKVPSTYPLNFGDSLTSVKLLTDLEYLYKKNCNVEIGAVNLKPTNVTNNNGTTGDKDAKPGSAAAGLNSANAFGSVVAAAAGVAGLLAYL